MGLLDDLRASVHNMTQPAQPYNYPSPQPQPQAPVVQPYDLNGVTASVTLDGSGNGTARITPGQAGPGRISGGGASRSSGLSWDVIGIAISVSTNIKEASA